MSVLTWLCGELRCLAWRVGIVCLAAMPVHAGADLSYLKVLLEATPEGGWVKANVNRFSDAWVSGPDALPPDSYSNPAAIVYAWSSFAWDPNRTALLLWGGGHENYRGNEMYVWQGSTGLWTRGSLPSRTERFGSTSTYYIVDDAAPQSAHTYDNNLFLRQNDLFLTFGGATFNSGNSFVRKGVDGSPVRAGPWVWDPRKADGNEVGGTTGSGYNPATVGGQMWVDQQGKWLGAEAPSYVNGTSAYLQENGRDVVYVTGDSNSSGWPSLYRYELADIRADELGRFEQIAVAWNVPSFQGAAVIDSRNRLYIRTSNVGASGLGVWDLLELDPESPNANHDVAVSLTLEDGSRFGVSAFHGIAYDEINDRVLLWDGRERGTVWETQARFDEFGGISPNWVVRRLPSTTAEQPNGNFRTGVLGKWHFVPELGAFIALDEFDGTSDGTGVWLYKPFGWRFPGSEGNVLPTVSLTSPATGTSVVAPASVVVSADASDGDGSVVRVDFYAGTTLIGSDSTAPYSVTWSNVGAGSYALTAVAVDNGGASTTSGAVSLTVTPAAGSGTVTLQDGVNGYAGTRDTYLSSYHSWLNFGTATSLLDGSLYTGLVRFAIFQAEGGPVPNGATIESATLSLYKASYYDYTYQVTRLLRDWREGEATWSQWRSGQPWSVAGAKGAGSDLAAVADATAVVGWAPQWLTANVTAGVQAMATGQPNYGWRLVGVSGNGNDKQFLSREYAADPTLRPKLVVAYTAGGTNTPPTVSLTSPANGTSVQAPASVVVSADAGDSDGSVSRVDFYAGTTLIGSDNTAPYSVTWSNVGAGSYALTAVAVDNAGASTTSGAVSLTVTPAAANVPPTVSITSPVAGTSVVAPASVVVSADASDGDGSVSRVDFYAGTTLIGSDNTAPYSVTWSNVGAGSYALTAVAVDNAGASTTSGAVSLTVTRRRRMYRRR